MDTISEFLTRVRNAGDARHEKLTCQARMFVRVSQKSCKRLATSAASKQHAMDARALCGFI